jgi:hypothetical protein
MTEPPVSDAEVHVSLTSVPSGRVIVNNEPPDADAVNVVPVVDQFAAALVGADAHVAPATTAANASTPTNRYCNSLRDMYLSLIDG